MKKRLFFPALIGLMMLLTVEGWGQINESFETGLPSSYTETTTFVLSSGTWTGSENQVIRSTDGVNTGSYSCQLKSQTGSQITTPILTGGVRKISFFCSVSTGTGGLQVLVSKNNGDTWEQVNGSPISFGTAINQYSFDVFDADVNKVQFYRTGGTVYIDDVVITRSREQPSEQPSNFSAESLGNSQIRLAWADASGAVLPDGYLIKASTTESITPPTSGVDPNEDTNLSDGNAIVKVGFDGLDEYTFTNLSANTSYHFKIWSYTNAGNMIDFLLSSPPSTSSITKNISLLISEISDPKDNYKGRFIELFNAGQELIDFNSTAVYLSRQTNGSTWYDFQLSGTISPKETIVIASYAEFLSLYAVSPDFSNGSFDGNGNDAVFIYFGGDHSSGTLLDIFGVISEDGSGKPWEYEDSRVVRNSNITTPNDTWTASEWTITVADVADFSPGEHNGTVSWKGGAGNWNTAASWSNGTVPSASDNIIIPEGASLSVDLAATVNNINVQDGGELTINTSQSLSVSDTITIESGGSYINYGTLDNGLSKGEADANVQCDINAYSSAANGWHLLSSPVAAFNINDNAGIDPGDNDDFYGWSESTYTWMNHKVGDPTQMVPGTGYLVAYVSTATKEFSGTLNNAAVPYSNLSKTADQGNGWHLVGNPFQSAITWNAPLADWGLTNINGTAKVMTNTGGFNDISAGGYIAAMQGFWIQAEVNADNSFTIPLTARNHNSVEWLKEADNNAVIIAANDLESGMIQKSWVRFNPDASEAYDMKYDSRFMVWLAPQLYSIVEGEMLSTNTYPELDEEMVIPFGFVKNEASNFSIELLESPEGQIVYLTDNKTDIVHNLTETHTYSFTASEGDNPNRFL
ncbi:MAG: hypothetical protein KJ754_15270, partial [Bacteroidetes bacterium]|nr:hypothetical protein [Bacteroidota bacterium]MBU1580788.1 hypothetical protein [Bacteroidota bacterium]